MIIHDKNKPKDKRNVMAQCAVGVKANGVKLKRFIHNMKKKTVKKSGKYFNAFAPAWFNTISKTRRYNFSIRY